VLRALRLPNSPLIQDESAGPTAGTAPANKAAAGLGIQFASPSVSDLPDLSRNVFGVLGVPLDAINFPTLIGLMGDAAGNVSPFLISTPNVNFLVKSQTNREFRESLLQSDLCLADGMPLIWIAKLLRIPIYERIAGADLFGRLKLANGSVRRLKVFLLGGAEGVAARVCEKLNSQRSGLECVGVLNPGFGNIEEISTPRIIDTINSSRADLLAVFFGAEKAQQWLIHNHHLLVPPIRAQFGATINFEAGTVKRAPRLLRSTGFEWLWRIKEEPYLWRRYWNDAKVLLYLLATCVLPLAIGARWSGSRTSDLSVTATEDATSITIELLGSAVCTNIDKAIDCFGSALAKGKNIKVDVARVRSVDPRFFGLFLMVRKQLASRDKQLNFIGISPDIRRIFRLNRFDFLL